jgi:hypothetical protein
MARHDQRLRSGARPAGHRGSNGNKPRQGNRHAEAHRPGFRPRSFASERAEQTRS